MITFSLVKFKPIMRNSKLSIALVVAITSNLYAQEKPPIDHSVFDDWKSISTFILSESGKYIYYTISPQEGDAVTELKDQNNNQLLRLNRGTASKLTKDDKYLINTIKPFYKETREAKIKKKKSTEMPKDSLNVFNITNKESINLGPITGWKTARLANNYLAYKQDIEINNNEKEKTDSSKKTKKSEPVVILYNLSSKDTVQFWKADTYYFDDNEKYLVFTKKNSGKDSTNISGLYIYDLKNKKEQKISNGKGTYKSIHFDDASKRLVFLADKSPEKSLTKDFKVYNFNWQSDTASIILDKESSGVPQNWYISGDANLSFNEQGNKLFLGLAPIPKVKDTTLVEFEHAKVDIWHWQDDYLMPQQLVNVNRDRTRNYEAVYNFESNQLIPLLDEKFGRFSNTVTANEEWGITSEVTKENKIATQWNLNTPQNVYLVSSNTGERKLIKSNHIGSFTLSPKATHVIFFNYENATTSVYNIKTQEETILNSKLSVSIVDELNDTPSLPRAYGIAGWAENEKGVYIYDRYDIWYFSFDGKEYVNITNGYGRKNRIVLRANHFYGHNPRKQYNLFSAKSTILLTSFNESTKENGYFSLKLDGKSNVQEIIQSKHSYRRLISNEDNSIYALTRENYEESPDIYLTKDLKTLNRITNINPQQNKYNWGTAELIKWKTPNGYEAEGILYKPENFDPNKKYPIISYFYETHTETLYSYHQPAPTPSRLMISYFVSNGYLVFSPDIRYQNGHPGKTAEEYVNSGMKYLAQNPWVDETKMAIQGQSWGGYQVAHLITSTDMYAAAWTGAPVVNMTSAYGGIRWQSGMSRQFQYEQTQSRIGATLWEAPELYIENSPLFHLTNVKTPVVIMSNDNDGAVPWYQGIEMFTALRRLQKPVWLLNYNGDEHNLMQRQNRKDIQIRQAQFFDHYLKDKPAPDWLKHGVKATEKGIDWGLEISE